MVDPTGNRYVAALKGFPDRLAEARKLYEIANRKDVTWDELARLVDMTPQVMSQVKNGKRPVRLEEVAVIAWVLGVRPAWLAFDEGPSRDTAQDGSVIDPVIPGVNAPIGFHRSERLPDYPRDEDEAATAPSRKPTKSLAHQGKRPPHRRRTG